MRTIGVVTVGRSDYGIYLPILRKIRSDPDLRFHLLVAGMHLSPEFGLTVNAIREDGFDIGEQVEMLLSSDTPEAIGKSMGLGLIGFSQAYARFRPDILLVLGDRFEMHAAVLAALPFKIPVAHIHGGEITEGAIDDALRHSITKLSHLHFVATEEYARRVKQMGEEEWRVVVTGAPALDNLRTIRKLKREELAEKLRFPLEPPPLLVTFHPVTLEYEKTEQRVEELLAALSAVELPVIFTAPNADTNGRVIARKIQAYIRSHPRSCLVSNLGTEAYFNLMDFAVAMVGNSSSGLIEAPSLGLPVVNIGNRQRGRVRAANVIDVGYASGEIREGIRKALEPEFRAALKGIPNPYGSGYAAEAIVGRLKEVPVDERLIVKRFVDWAAPAGVGDSPRIAQ